MSLRHREPPVGLGMESDIDRLDDLYSGLVLTYAPILSKVLRLSCLSVVAR